MTATVFTQSEKVACWLGLGGTHLLLRTIPGKVEADHAQAIELDRTFHHKTKSKHIQFVLVSAPHKRGNLLCGRFKPAELEYTDNQYSDPKH